MDADDLRRLAGQTGFDVGMLEKDYALTWLLHGIYADGSPLADVLVFKGGTAIRKVYAPEWRLSEDLDFTVTKNVKPGAIKKGFEKVFEMLEEWSGFTFEFSQFHDKPYYVQARVRFVGPFNHPNKIKIDISFTEKLVEDPVRIPVEDEYDVPAFAPLAYTLNEVLVEKIRSIFQRGYARDYYDVWRLLKERDFDTDEIRKLLVKKCELADVDSEPELLFDEARLAEAERHWETALSRLTPDLPEFERVIRGLEDSIAFLAQQ